MLEDTPSTSHRIPWKLYISLTVQSLLAFYIATFSLAIFFLQKGPRWWMGSVVLTGLYLFVIYACAKRIAEKLPLAAIMLIIPIAPLFALIIVVTLLPVLEKLLN